MLFPVIEVVPCENIELTALIERLDEFDIAIFVSPNAAHQGLHAITTRRTFPAKLRVAAIGRATMRELERYGVRQVIAPARFDSEALLDMPEMREVAGAKIVVFRAQGGREMLGQTLTARGAIVHYAQCYSRRQPQTDAAPLIAAWARGEVHAVTATSSEGVRNLRSMLGERGYALLGQTPLFVSHPRIAASARELGLAQVVTTGQGDEGLLEGLVQWFGRDPAQRAVYSAHATD